jgi:amino acid transporter
MAEPKFYTRNATGLVRDIGLSSNLALNISFISLPLAAFVATQAPFAFPGSNLVGVVVITAVLCIFPTLLYGMLAQAMPRSGGDYVFISRIFHPLVGFVANFNITMWFQLVIALFGSYLAPLGLSAALSSISQASGNKSLGDLATTVSGKDWQFALGAVALVATAALMSIRLATAMRIFRWMFYLSLVGVVITVALTLLNGRAEFMAAVTKFGGNYNQMIADAKAAGWPGYGSGIDWGATLAATPLAFASFGYAIVSTYAAGEIRSATKVMTRSLLLALGISAIVVLVMLGLAARTFGEEWMGAAQYLATNVPAKYTLPSYPGYLFFATMLTDNVPLIAIAAASYALAFVVALPPTFLIATRSLFAWSFDRILPDRVASVNDRTHSPIVANVIVLVITLVLLVITVFGPGEFLQILFTAGAAEILTFLVVAAAGAAFAYRRPDLWRGSPASQTLGGVAVLTIVGLISIVVYIIFLVPLLTNTALGANAPIGIEAMIAMPIIGLAIYGVSYAWNRRRGIDLGMAFQELPPE